MNGIQLFPVNETRRISFHSNGKKLRHPTGVCNIDFLCRAKKKWRSMSLRTTFRLKEINELLTIEENNLSGSWHILQSILLRYIFKALANR